MASTKNAIPARLKPIRTRHSAPCSGDALGCADAVRRRETLLRTKLGRPHHYYTRIKQTGVQRYETYAKRHKPRERDDAVGAGGLFDFTWVNGRRWMPMEFVRSDDDSVPSSFNGFVDVHTH